jgi:hypothetical protein
VNGERITDVELKAGDAIDIGEFELAFSYAEQPAPVAAAAPMATASLAPAPTLVAAPAPAKPKKQAAKGPATATLAYESKSSEGPKPLGDCDIDWVMKLRNGAILMYWAVTVKYALWYLLGWFGMRAVLRAIPHSAEIKDILTCGLMGAGIWLLTSREPGVQGDSIGARVFLRAVGIVAYLGSAVLTVGLMLENETIGVAGAILAIAQVPTIALLLFYIRRLALRIPNVPLAYSAVLLMIVMPVFVGMAGWAAYQAFHGAPGQALGFGLLALIGLFVCEVCRCGVLIWFSKSFS